MVVVGGGQSDQKMERSQRVNSAHAKERGFKRKGMINSVTCC